MVFSFSVGSRCAIMLPREVVNDQVTPAKGIVINRTIGNLPLILVEEVWKFKGINTSPISDMVFMSSGCLRSEQWGWTEVPSILVKESYLIVPAGMSNLMTPTHAMLAAMIEKSVADFKSINNIM